MILPSPIQDADVAAVAKLIFNQPLETADVIIWLQGDQMDRGKQIIDLYNKKLAPLILVSGNNELVGPGKRVGENDFAVSELISWLKRNHIPTKSILLDTQSLNTFEQAIKIATLSKQHRWKKIILVTSPYHQVRAFLTVLKAFTDSNIAHVRIINQPAQLPWNKLVSGRKKTAAEMWLVEQDKIYTYHKDMAKIKDGIKYLESI
jgi:uncharacterized SAM-binding protein YcdF (DUF218 family)